MKPAATAEPITPATLGPMECMSRKLEGFAFCPSICDTRAAIGTADYACRTDQRIHLAAGDNIHQLAQQQSADCTEHECEET